MNNMLAITNNSNSNNNNSTNNNNNGTDYINIFKQFK